MNFPEIETVDCDVLIVGGGMAGCAANIWQPFSPDRRAVIRGRGAIGSLYELNRPTVG